MNKLNTFIVSIGLIAGSAQAAVTEGSQLLCQSEDSALYVTDQDPAEPLQLPDDCGTLPAGLVYEVIGKHIGAFYNAKYITFVGSSRNGTQGWLFERK